MSEEKKDKKRFGWFRKKDGPSQAIQDDGNPDVSAEDSNSEVESVEEAEASIATPEPSVIEDLEDDYVDEALKAEGMGSATVSLPAELEAVADAIEASKLEGTTSDSSTSEDEPKKKRSFFGRLKDGLSRSSNSFSEGISGIFTRKKLDDDTLEELEDLLIMTDLGMETVQRITGKLAKDRFDKEISEEEIKEFVAAEVADILDPLAVPFQIDNTKKPHVVLMIGVNGTGKTTTLGKMAAREIMAGRKVMIAACDTFRAAAAEQLKVWGDRAGAPVMTREPGADAAGLAFDALQQARDDNVDVLFIDTAGRLHNKKELMAELEKIVRVIKKIDQEAPHSVLLVLDATTGQNALAQVEVFSETTNVTGLIMTKLDGTARGGILVAVAAKFGLPLHAIGVGEEVGDFQPFKASEFARALVGLEEGPRGTHL